MSKAKRLLHAGNARLVINHREYKRLGSSPLCHDGRVSHGDRNPAGWNIHDQNEASRGGATSFLLPSCPAAMRLALVVLAWLGCQKRAAFLQHARCWSMVVPVTSRHIQCRRCSSTGLSAQTRNVGQMREASRSCAYLTVILSWSSMHVAQGLAACVLGTQDLRFPNGLKLMFKIKPRAQKLEVSVNEKTLVSKSISKLLEEDVTGLWPTDKAKIKAEIRGWLEDSPKDLLQKATLRDPSVREKTGSSWFEIIGSITVILSIGVGIYTLTYLMALGLKSGPREETEPLDNYEL